MQQDSKIEKNKGPEGSVLAREKPQRGSWSSCFSFSFCCPSNDEDLDRNSINQRKDRGTVTTAHYNSGQGSFFASPLKLKTPNTRIFTNNSTIFYPKDTAFILKKGSKRIVSKILKFDLEKVNASGLSERMGTDHKIGKRSLTGSGEGTASLPRNDTVDFSRREIFSLYHRGIQIDKEDWNDVTPECVARHVAKKLQGKFIIDALSGYGGNTIQFAKYSPCVIGIEIDPHKLKNAKHNAEIYGVGDAIEFVNADFFSMKKLKADVVFLAPSELPVEKNQKFSLEHHLSPSLPQLIRHSLKLASSLVISLPPNTCIDELAAVFSDIYQENPDGYASLNYTLQIDLLSIDESLISMIVYFGGNNQISAKEQKDLVYETISMSELRSSQESLSENAIHHLIESVGLHRSLNMISNIEESLATQKRNDEGIISIFLTQLIQQNLLSNEILAQWQKEPESPMLSSTKSSKSGQSLGLALMGTEKTPSLHDPPILLSTPSIKQLSKILSIQNSLKNGAQELTTCLEMDQSNSNPTEPCKTASMKTVIPITIPIRENNMSVLSIDTAEMALSNYSLKSEAMLDSYSDNFGDYIFAIDEGESDGKADMSRRETMKRLQSEVKSKRYSLAESGGERSPKGKLRTSQGAFPSKKQRQSALSKK